MRDGPERATMRESAPGHPAVLGFPEVGREHEQAFAQFPRGACEGRTQLRELLWPVQWQVVPPYIDQIFHSRLAGVPGSSDLAGAMQNRKEAVHAARKKTGAPRRRLDLT